MKMDIKTGSVIAKTIENNFPWSTLLSTIQNFAVKPLVCTVALGSFWVLAIITSFLWSTKCRLLMAALPVMGMHFYMEPELFTEIFLSLGRWVFFATPFKWESFNFYNAVCVVHFPLHCYTFCFNWYDSTKSYQKPLVLRTRFDLKIFSGILKRFILLFFPRKVNMAICISVLICAEYEQRSPYNLSTDRILFNQI